MEEFNLRFWISELGKLRVEQCTVGSNPIIEDDIEWIECKIAELRAREIKNV